MGVASATMVSSPAAADTFGSSGGKAEFADQGAGAADARRKRQAGPLFLASMTV